MDYFTTNLLHLYNESFNQQLYSKDICIETKNRQNMIEFIIFLAFLFGILCKMDQMMSK